jgi:hypothetical protein
MFKSFNGVFLIKTNYTREYSTRPGMYVNSLSKVNVVRQIMKNIHTTISKEEKAPIELDWRTECDLDDSKIIEPGLTHTSPTLEVNTLDKIVDDDTTRMGSGVPLVSPVLPKLRTNTLDKCTRRKPVMRSSDFLWRD